MSNSFRVVIPVRYASSRLPGKPLLTFQHKPIIEHVYQNACESNAESVLIATDDERIAEAAIKFDAQVCMTSSDHMSGTDRITEAVEQQGWADDEVIVNVQGDEPQMPAANIKQVADLLLKNTNAMIGTLCQRIQTIQEYDDPNVVKVTKNSKGRALYFSRSSLPFIRNVDVKVLKENHVFRHVGIYAYRVRYLKQFIKMSPSPLEMIEKLEQLRALENGDEIIIDECLEYPGIGVDTMDDYHRLKINN
ncbi:MAG: 3-deoxy-manno-octulosonate cytidylyltransferase [Gammaproteobacteria bacterium]|nr:3-deoxy-manno-octulosonate cytidylyltransferase [Gammaproteobacteria bacterium]